MQRREMAKMGPRQSNFTSSLSSNQYQSVRTTSPDISATSYYDSYKAESAAKKSPTPLKGKGMQLGKKTNTKLYNALSSEIASIEAAGPITQTPTATTVQDVPVIPVSSEGIQISLNETVNAKANRDAGIEAMEVQGLLNLHISDSALSRIYLGVHSVDTDGTQFKTHPNVDRNLFKDQHKIGLRDANRPFPLNQQISVLRWRLQARPNDTALPISGNLSHLTGMLMGSKQLAFSSGRWLNRCQHRI